MNCVLIKNRSKSTELCTESSHLVFYKFLGWGTKDREEVQTHKNLLAWFLDDGIYWF